MTSFQGIPNYRCRSRRIRHSLFFTSDLRFDGAAVDEGDLDVVFSMNRHMIDQSPPVLLAEFRERTVFFQALEITRDSLPPDVAASNILLEFFPPGDGLRGGRSAPRFFLQKPPGQAIFGRFPGCFFG